MKTLANFYQIRNNSDQILWRQPAKHGVAFLPNNKMINGTNRERLTVSNQEFLQRQRNGRTVSTRPQCSLNSFRQTAIYREILKGKSEHFAILLAVFQIAKWTFEKVIQTVVYRVMLPIIKGDFVTIATSSGPRTCMVKHTGIITSTLRTEGQEDLLVPNHLLMNNCLWRSGPKNPIVGFGFSFPLSTNIETMRLEVEEIMSGLTFVIGGSTEIHVHDMDRDKKKVYNVRISCSIKLTNEEEYFRYRGQIIISFANLLARHI